MIRRVDTSLRETQIRPRDALRARASGNNPVQIAAGLKAIDRINDSLDTLTHMLAKYRQTGC